MSRRRASPSQALELDKDLQGLADALGILTRYRDAAGVSQHAKPEALYAMFRALGEDVSSARDARAARQRREAERVRRGVEPVVVAWAGMLEALTVWCEPSVLSGHYEAHLTLEDGRTLEKRGPLGEGARLDASEGQDALSLVLPIGMRLPFGYHVLTLRWAGRERELLVIAAPRSAPRASRSFGLFAPTYALRGPTGAGTGTLAELGALLDEVTRAGGRFVATLPLLAQFLDQPFDTSPFAPASRLFWNELFLDPGALEGGDEVASVRERLASPAFVRERAALEAKPFLDARGVIAQLHSLLQPLALHFFEKRGDASLEFRAFLRDNPYAEDYASYRGVLDAYRLRGEPLPKMTSRRLDQADPARRALHLFAQYQLHLQLTRLTRERRGARLYLDLPVGVHSQSFDVFCEPSCFVHGVTVGAPPDALCPEGQNWGFAPSHPEGQRAQGYRYMRSFVRGQLRHAGILRIDHVMGLSRIFCIPEGMSAAQGLYLRQPQDEQYAIFALEASRNDSVLVGEDLGIVPDEVRAAMSAHGFHRMYVLPFELDRSQERAEPKPMPGLALSALNTHDMPSFAGLFAGDDIDERLARGVLTPEAADDEREERAALVRDLSAALDLAPDASRAQALEAALRHLGEGQSELVLVALEDLWGERAPQNVPGTFDPERNFCRRMAQPVDALRTRSEVSALLRLLREARQGGETETSAPPG